MINRRQLLSTAALGALAVGVVGCTEAQTVSTAVTAAAQQLAETAHDISAALANVLPNATGITAAANTVITDIESGVSRLQAFETSISNAVQSGVAAAAPIVSQFASVAGNVVDDITGLGGVGVTLPSWVADVVTAVKTLVPIAMSLAGLALATAQPTGMSPAQARVILKAHAP